MVCWDVGSVSGRGRWLSRLSIALGRWFGAVTGLEPAEDWVEGVVRPVYDGLAAPEAPEAFWAATPKAARAATVSAAPDTWNRCRRRNASRPRATSAATSTRGVSTRSSRSLISVIGRALPLAAAPAGRGAGGRRPRSGS